ncbi:MAG: Gfo/Idh/MocA family oxidoreductase [Candidatus Poribacteria bacterium]|nr:Gfo/Idh/MocA family oxidoreductase [Candidatus Poribacteria bacterium]
MSVVKVGFIGVGGVAGGHLRNISNNENSTLVAICDVNEGLLARRKEEFNVPTTYTNYRTMLEREQLGAVYVCVPPFAHGDIELEVAKAGVPLFVEKPVELHMDAALRKYEAIRDAGIVNAAGYCVRYMDTVDIMRNRLEGHAVELASGFYMGGMPGGPGHWWQQVNKSGGQLVEQSTHILDLARYVVGEVEAVGGAFVRRVPFNESADVENASIASLYFENGAVGTITSACNISQGFGTGLNLFAKNFIIEYTYGGMKVRGEGDPETFKTGNDMYAAEDAVFIDAVRSGDKSAIRSDYRDAVKSLEVSLLARQASEKRAVIETTFRG